MKKAIPAVKAALGGGAAILLLAAAPAARASVHLTVPCRPAALIAAINAANGSGGGTLNLATGCTYNLTSAASSNMFGGNGLPVITSAITLNGIATTIAGNHSNFRIFMVAGSGDLTLQGLTITGGSTPGPGGGIFNLEGRLILNHSRVIGNASAGGMMSAGGGIASGTLGTGPVGTTILNFSQVDDNSTSGSAGGILNHGGTLILHASQVDGNTAAGGGGGIASGSGTGGTGASVLLLNASQVNGNTSLGGPDTGAGGIANGGAAVINGSKVIGNAAPGAAGGGILNHGTMTINVSLVADNTALTDGSGDHGAGGGIANLNFAVIVPGVTGSGVLTINNSQIRGNTASGIGGGIVEATVDADGGLTLPGNELTLKFSLVTNNSAAQGGGIYAVEGSLVSLVFTPVTANRPDNCFPPGAVPGCVH